MARAVDLTSAGMSDEEALRAQEMIELQLGMRCGGCGRRIAVGLQFMQVAVRSQSPVMKLSACARGDCDFAEHAKDGATSMQVIEYVWLDEAGANAPATPLVTPTAPVNTGRASEIG